MKDRWTVILAAAGFGLVSVAGAHPALVILAAAVAGYIFYPKELWEKPETPGSSTE